MFKEEFQKFQLFLEERNYKVILHIPHVKMDFPKHFFKGLKINVFDLAKYIFDMTDLYVDKIYKDFKVKKIIPKYSRLYCDVERFRDDNIEDMSKCGQGVVYTHTYDGTLFHSHDESYKNKVLKYYDKYHNKFNKIVLKELKKGYNVLILDCHSFSEEVVSFLRKGSFPDICIGINDEFVDTDILNYIKNRILKKGYKYQVNFPYAGSIIPNIIYDNKDEYCGRVCSIMIEMNKKVYLQKN